MSENRKVELQKLRDLLDSGFIGSEEYERRLAELQKTPLELQCPNSHPLVRTGEANQVDIPLNIGMGL